jgi:hypothetical protein
MKKFLYLFLLLPFLAISQAVPADASQFENIQLTNNATDNAALKVSVQDANGVLNTIAKADLVEVLEYSSAAALPTTGQAGKIYVTIDNQRQYRWTGTFYNEFFQFKANLESPTFTGSVVVPNATLSTQAVNKGQLDLLSHAAATGIAEGGVLSINTDAAKFDLSAGFGYIVNGHSDVENPTNRKVTWAAKIANAVPNIASQKQTYVAIDINGDLFLTANPLTATQRRNYIRLGVLIHLNNSTVAYTDNQPTINIEVGGQVQDILDFLGFRSISGNRIFPVGANLKIKKELGTVFKPGANFNNLITQPHSFVLAAQNPATFRYRTQIGVEGLDITDINPAIYDLNGAFTAMPATATLATIQRVYVFQDNSIRIQPGEKYFDNLNQAITAIESDIFITDSDISNNGLFLGSIVLIRGATALNTLAQAIFVPSAGTSSNGSVATAPLGYIPEDVANKQNNLNVDGSGAKYPTVDAVNSGLNLKANLESPTFTGTVSGITKAQVGLSNVQNTDLTSAVNANSAKVGITTTQASDITANNAKVGITTTQASDITANNAKVGITTTQASNITANNDKISFDSTSSTRLANTSGTNTGDQDLSGYQLKSEKDANSGYAGLDSSGKINPLQLPAIAITETFVVNSQAAMLATASQTGDVAVRTDVNKTFILTADAPATLANWQELLSPLSEVTSVFGRTGAVTAQNGDYTKAQVGLSNVQNTDLTSAVNANSAKVGITTTQASDITANNAKVGITTTQASNIVTNNGKISFDNTSSTRLANTSGTNTGDQTLSSLDAAPSSGSTNYIQNQNTSAQSANIWINGSIKSGYFNPNTTPVLGGLGYTSLKGSLNRGIIGSAYDYAIETPTGSTIFGNPTGTVNAQFQGALEVAGAATFSSSVTATNGIFSGNILTGGATARGYTKEIGIKGTSNAAFSLSTDTQLSDIVSSSSNSFQFFDRTAAKTVLSFATSTGSATFASSVTSGGNLKIIRPLDVGTTFMQIEVGDVSTTFNGQDPDGYMNYNFNSNGTNRLFINGQSGAATFASSVTATNFNLPAAGRLSSGASYITPEDNIQGARVVTAGGFLVESAGATFSSSVTATDGIFSGNVGIKRTSPLTPLHVSTGFSKTDTNERGVARFSSSDITNPSGLVIQLKGGASQADRIATIQTDEPNVVSGGKLALQPFGGNLLVGTQTDNGSKLQVEGAATFSSSVTAGNTSNNNISIKVLDGTIITKIQSQTIGDTAGAIGTESNNDLKLITNNTERLRFLASTGAASFSSSVTATSHVTTGGTASQFVKGDGSLSAGYKVYTALVNQVGTNAPVATVLENTLGGTVVWTRSLQGVYFATLNSAFTNNKTFCLSGNNVVDGQAVKNIIQRNTVNQIVVETYFNTTKQDGILNNTSIEIRVYN